MVFNVGEKHKLNILILFTNEFRRLIIKEFPWNSKNATFKRCIFIMKRSSEDLIFEEIQIAIRRKSKLQ
jgi:hypothetical protein